MRVIARKPKENILNVPEYIGALIYCHSFARLPQSDRAAHACGSLPVALAAAGSATVGAPRGRMIVGMSKVTLSNGLAD